MPVSYTHLRAHETGRNLVCRLLLENGLKQCGSAGAERYELLLHLGLALTPSDPDKAVNCYRQALEIPLDTRVSLGARLNMAARLMDQGNLEKAISLTQTAAQRAPEVALAWYNLGLMQRRRGDLAAALEAYGRASAWIPTTLSAIRTMPWPSCWAATSTPLAAASSAPSTCFRLRETLTLLSSCAKGWRGW